MSQSNSFNSLAPKRCKYFTRELFKLILQVDILSISCEVGLRQLPQNPTNDKST